MSYESAVFSIVQGLQKNDPRVFDALNKMATDLYALFNQINPPTGRTFGVTGSLPSVAQPTGFTATIYDNNVRLVWDNISGISNYELRYNVGTSTDWDSASVLLKTSTLSADINPLTIPLTYGSYTFLLKGINSNGTYSITASSVTITIPQIGAPTVSATVIDNNVLLKWTAPSTTFRLSHYNVYKGGVLSGNMNGTFEAFFETVSGTYTYTVEAVDIVGNVSTQGSVIAIVNQPPDYELTDSRFSDLSGTKVNCKKENDYLLVCIDTSKTYQHHFDDNSWASPQAQVTAGYPIFIEPAATTASYEEIINYGTLINNTIVTVRWAELTVSGSVTVTAKIATSTDGITYTAFTTASSVFAQSLQYAKIRFEFAGATDKSLLQFSNLNILLDVKRELDSGNIDVHAADVSGTAVTFNKTFKDIDSITLTPNSTTLIIAVYDFVDVPNPTGFSIYAFDSSGTRVDANISWKARGIV